VKFEESSDMSETNRFGNDDDSDSSVNSQTVETGEDSKENNGDEEETQSLSNIVQLVHPAAVSPNAEGVIEVIDDFHFNSRTFNDQRLQGRRSFTWKGAEWSNFLICSPNHSVGLFLGYNDPSSLPDDFFAHLSFRYILLNSDGEELFPGKNLLLFFQLDSM
jgi:hypothetical protein